MVKGIEHFYSELQRMRFCNQEVFVKSKSPGLIRGPDDEIPSRVAIGKRCGFEKDGFVEPAIRSRIVNLRIPIEVWSLGNRTCSNIRDIARNSDIGRLA
jgi:hypothetical protein